MHLASEFSLPFLRHTAPVTAAISLQSSKFYLIDVSYYSLVSGIRKHSRQTPNPYHLKDSFLQRRTTASSPCRAQLRHLPFCRRCRQRRRVSCPLCRSDDCMHSPLLSQLYYGMHVSGSPVPVTIAPAAACSTISVSLASSSMPSVATAGVASQFLLTMRDSSANAVNCNSSALSVWLSGQSYAAAAVENDASGACRVVFSVLEVIAQWMCVYVHMRGVMYQRCLTLFRPESTRCGHLSARFMIPHRALSSLQTTLPPTNPPPPPPQHAHTCSFSSLFLPFLC